MEEHPIRIVRIEAAAARAFERAPAEFTTVTSAAQADKALGDPGNTHHCPLCNEFFGTLAFKQHAYSCIQANAPRWERQRDRIPPYAKPGTLKRQLAGVTQLRGRLFGAARREQ